MITKLLWLLDLNVLWTNSWIFVFEGNAFLINILGSLSKDIHIYIFWQFQSENILKIWPLYIHCYIQGVGISVLKIQWLRILELLLMDGCDCFVEKQKVEFTIYGTNLLESALDISINWRIYLLTGLESSISVQHQIKTSLPSRRSSNGYIQLKTLRWRVVMKFGYMACYALKVD